MLENSISPQSESDRLPKWPWLPWVMLIGLILWLLFGRMSCAVKPTLIPQTETTSRVVSANYGTFSILDFKSSRNFLVSGTMGDGRINILYKSATEIEPIIFDPTTTTFTPRHESIVFRKNVGSGEISQALLINDSTVVIIFGGAEELLSGGGEESTWAYGKIINLDSGEVIDIVGQEQIGEIRVLAELNDQKFAIAGIKGKAHRDMLITDPDYDKLPTGIIKTFDLVGKEIESKELTGTDGYAIPTTTTTNTYDRGDDVLIFSDRLAIFDKTKLTFTPVSNTTKATTIERLPNGLLLACWERSINWSDWETGGNSLGNEIYLFNPENLQSLPITLATALPIREQLLTGITEFTDENTTAALAPLKLQYRVSVLADGTVLLAANNFYDIAQYHWLIDLNGYKMLQPANQTTRARLSTSLQDQWIGFDNDITLADGRVLYLGARTVLYTPASERTPGQEAISQSKTNLPDWPSTDFKTQGVWATAKKTSALQKNYEANLAEEQARYIVEVRGATYRIGLPQTGIPACDAVPPKQGNCRDTNPSYNIERYNAATKKWSEAKNSKLAVARKDESVTALLDGKVVIVGGIANVGSQPAEEPLDNGRYTQNWMAGTITLYGKTFGKVDPVLYYSGLGMSAADLQKLNVKLGFTKSVEIYNPKTNKSEEIGKLKIGRSGHQVVILPDDKIAIIGGDEQPIIVKDSRGNFQSVTHTSSTYEIFDLKTGESKLYENVLMFRHDTHGFQTFMMPNGHIYIGDSGVYSGAEVLDWQNGVSYPTGQPTLRGLGTADKTARLENELISLGAEQDEIRNGSNAIIGQILDTSVIGTYRLADTGRQLPIAQLTAERLISSSYAWLWLLYLQLAQLLLGLPLAYLLGVIKRKRQKFVVPL